MFTKITKTASLGKIETAQSVANPDPEVRHAGRVYPIFFGCDQIQRNVMGRACSMYGGVEERYV